jgi:hypothetical protein
MAFVSDYSADAAPFVYSAGFLLLLVEGNIYLFKKKTVR